LTSADNDQELGQSNISLVKKNQLKESFEKILGELQAVTKAKTAADQKLVSQLRDIDAPS
jgi:hypothetical protein